MDVKSFESSFRNASMAFLPSAADLLFAVPRLARKASSFALLYIPDQLDGFFSMARNSGSIIADATSRTSSINNITRMTSTPAILQSPVATQTSTALATEPGFFTGILQGFSLQKLSNLDSVFSYLASRWAISTFFIAIILNRAHVYASSRRHLKLNWYSRLVLRTIPIALFLYQIPAILQVMRCQTGDFLSQADLTDVERILNGAFTREGGPLHSLSSFLLFWQTDQQSCQKSGMIPPDGKRSPVYGSSSVLWPLFISLCISHFVETISCALQGRQPMAETGMTIFEHSLAFAEAEAVVRSSVGLSMFSLPQLPATLSSTQSSTATPSSSATNPKQIITRAMIMQRLNVPPEVLLIALISSLSHLSSHILGVMGLQSRFRLINTGVWGICFMCAFGWSFVKFSQSSDQGDIGVLRYPTVCIIGFIPHLMIIAGSLLCLGIYIVAILMTVLSPPTRVDVGGSIWQRIVMAHENLQASTLLSSIQISWKDEFYTTLLKIGFSVLTAASEAVYFNEGPVVTVNSRTWLEDSMIEELTRSRKHAQRLRANIPVEIQCSLVVDGLALVDVDSSPPTVDVPIISGYGRERKTAKSTGEIGAAALKEEGTGGTQRSGRWILSWALVRQILQLVLCCSAKITIRSLQACGIVRLPSWLRNIAILPTSRGEGDLSRASSQEHQQLEFWMLSEDGNMFLPSDGNVDVEYETRKRLLRSDEPQDGSEQAIDRNLYDWWKSGGWWGDIDSSGEYKPDDMEDDNTSIVSTIGEDNSGWQSDTDDGRITPTQATFDRSRETSQAPDDTLADIARMLDPRTLEDKQEARLLAQHLRSDRPMTRLYYRRTIERDRLRLLSPTRRTAASGNNTAISQQEEEDLLERIISSRRLTSVGDEHSGSRSWTDGAEGMGDSGPQCVVCHSSPRTIIVWPCRCLSLCEDCRVSLAMNNFGSCVCCRRDVVAFSRLYVP